MIIVFVKLSRVVSAAAAELAAVGEGERVDDEVQPAPRVAYLGEDLVDGCEIAHVAGDDDFGADRLGERMAPAEGLALIGEGELAPWPASTRAMPHAIDRSLATP